MDSLLRDRLLRLQGIELRKFNPLQPRDPGGEGGGQWVKGGSAFVDLAKRLASGDFLDAGGEDEDEARLATAIETWVDGEDLSRIKSEMRNARNQPDTDGAALMFALQSAPRDAPTLYRGMSSVHPSLVPEVGKTINLGPTSFTSSNEVATKFAQTDVMSDVDEDEPAATAAMFVEVAPGARALNIESQADWSGQFEHISDGTFRVVDRTTTTGTVRNPASGETREVTLYMIKVEQVDE